MNSLSKKLILLQGKIYAENQTVTNGYIKIVNGQIIEIAPLIQLSNQSDFQLIKLPDGFTMIPGMIDIHIHGTNGADTMDATKEALDVMTSTLPKEGTTSFLATTMTEDSSAIKRALRNVGEYMESFQRKGQAEILGIHLEGPFIHKDKAGAQPIQHILNPNLDIFKQWQALSGGHIKVVTLAPELPGANELIQHLKKQNIVTSIGHSKSTYAEALLAIKKGASHITHLFNQMTGLHHRDPGIVGAAFLHHSVMAEIIVDGIHVSPEMVHLAYKQITDERMILITDSMRAKWLKNGEYDLGGQLVTVKNNKALLDKDTLAGSVLKMKDAFKNIQQFTNCDLRSAIKMTSENPAKQLNIFNRKGSIAIGKDADIVVLDKQMEVYMTLCKGNIAYKKKEESYENH